MIDLPENDLLLKSANRKVRKLLARAYLREYRLEEALEVYLTLLAEDANDGYVLMVLGNLYRLAGSLETAARLYERALALDPANLAIQRQLAQTRSRAGEKPWVIEVEPLSLPAVMRLAQRLRGVVERMKNEAAQQERENAENFSEPRKDLRAEICGAAEMLEKFIPEERAAPAGISADAVQQLMPALIEMNIRHARATGRPDLAEALQSLQISVRRQTGSLKREDEGKAGV